MEFSERDLEHLERLARVRIVGESRDKLRHQLARIIEFVRRLQAVDTSGFEPRARVGGSGAAMRPDETRPCLPRDAVLAAAPERRESYFGVPRVIDTEEN